MNDVANRAIEIARSYVGFQESKVKPNWAPWLDALFERAGGKRLFGWQSPAPYCIAAAAACFAAACKELGKKFPLFGTASTQTFFENAKKLNLTGQTPEIGDIAVFRVGNQWHGHAGIVIAVKPESVDLIEFNTSSTVAGSQRNGDGVWLKCRQYKDFRKTDKPKLWLRGFVKTSQL